MRRLVWLLIPLALAACGDEGGSNTFRGNPWGYASVTPLLGPQGGNANPDGGAQAIVSVTGRVTFDRLPVTASGLGPTPIVGNAAFVLVEAVRHDTWDQTLAVSETDASGNYTLNFSTTFDFYIRARAQSGSGPDVDRVYHDRTFVGPVVYGVSGAILNRSTASHICDLHADATLPYLRGGAFAALDTVRRLRLAAVGAIPSLGSLDVFWSPGNVSADAPNFDFISGTVTDANGPNGRPTIHLMGGVHLNVENTDHDEFDETVIAHEWASFLQLTQSRDNNFGGPHAGQELIVSASYSEGVVTAIGCALLGERLYRDTVGLPGGPTSVQFEFDCESGVIPGTGTGYGNEFRNTRAVWDLVDGGAGSPADTDADPCSIALADFLNSFADLRTRTAPYEVAWLASLLQELVDDAHLNTTDANTIMTTHGEAFPPAGGDNFPIPLIVGGAADTGNLDAWAGADPNSILGPQANGLWRIELASAQSVTIDVTNTAVAYDAGMHRLDLTVHDLSRNIVAQDIGSARDKTVTANLTAGTYIVRVQHIPASQADSAPTTYTVQAQ